MNIILKRIDCNFNKKVKGGSKMKKSVSLIIAMVLIVTMLAGCSSNKPADNNDSTKTYSLKLGYNTPDNSVRGEMSKEFKRVVEEKSNNRIKIELFPAEALGSEQEQLESVKLGAQDFSLPGSGAMSPMNPIFGMFSLPFAVENPAEMHMLQDGEFGQIIKDVALENGYVQLAFGDLGFAQITNNKKAINSVADMKGLKMRSPNEPVLINTLSGLGSAVTTMPFTEIYLALSQGVVDGQFNPIDAIYQSKFQEVQKYLAVVNIFGYNINFVASEITWDKLDDEAKAIIQEAALAAQEVSREYYKNIEKEFLAKASNDFIEVTNPDTKEFRDAVQSIYDEYAKTINQKDYDVFNNALSEYRKNK